MPRGIEGIKAAREDIKARSGGGGWFKIGDGEEAVIRPLENGDELAFAWVHELPKQENERFPKLEVCRDQSQQGEPCPGCENAYRRRFRGWLNIIWRNAPVRDSKNDEKKDQLAIWNAGIEVFETLGSLDGHYKGLMTRDFTVRRTGEKLETKWHIMPEDPSPFSKADEKLAENKADLDKFITPKSLEEWGKRDEKKDEDGEEGSEKAESPFQKRKNPFAKPKQD